MERWSFGMTYKSCSGHCLGKRLPDWLLNLCAHDSGVPHTASWAQAMRCHLNILVQKIPPFSTQPSPHSVASSSGGNWVVVSSLFKVGFIVSAVDFTSECKRRRTENIIRLWRKPQRLANITNRERGRGEMSSHVVVRLTSLKKCKCKLM